MMQVSGKKDFDDRNAQLKNFLNLRNKTVEINYHKIVIYKKINHHWSKFPGTEKMQTALQNSSKNQLSEETNKSGRSLKT